MSRLERRPGYIPDLGRCHRMPFPTSLLRIRFQFQFLLAGWFQNLSGNTYFLERGVFDACFFGLLLRSRSESHEISFCKFRKFRKFRSGPICEVGRGCQPHLPHLTWPEAKSSLDLAGGQVAPPDLGVFSAF